MKIVSFCRVQMARPSNAGGQTVDVDYVKTMQEVNQVGFDNIKARLAKQEKTSERYAGMLMRKKGNEAIDGWKQADQESKRLEAALKKEAHKHAISKARVKRLEKMLVRVYVDTLGARDALKPMIASEPALFAEVNKICVDDETGVRGFCPVCVEPVVGTSHDMGGQTRWHDGKHYFHAECRAKRQASDATLVLGSCLKCQQPVTAAQDAVQLTEPLADGKKRGKLRPTGIYQHNTCPAPAGQE